MRYFIDTEFIDDGKTIALVSIGIVAEDGREYYAQSMEYDASKASDWVKEHVLYNLVHCAGGTRWHHEMNERVGLRCMGRRLACGCPWRTRAEIKAEILAFMDVEKYPYPELWGYYSAYDHLAFCQLFGTMMDLPKGFPMYTRDIKQWCDALGNPRLPEQGKGEHNALADARWNVTAWEFLRDYAAKK